MKLAKRAAHELAARLFLGCCNALDFQISSFICWTRPGKTGKSIIKRELKISPHFLPHHAEFSVQSSPSSFSIATAIKGDAT